jgi:hypothetical protein
MEDETGIMWDSELKRQRFDPETSTPVAAPVKREEPKAPPQEPPMVIIPIAEDPIEPKEANPLECDMCGFTAKTKAGLAVHKLKH